MVYFSVADVSKRGILTTNRCNGRGAAPLSSMLSDPLKVGRRARLVFWGGIVLSAGDKGRSNG